jgi:hypothetical protein
MFTLGDKLRVLNSEAEVIVRDSTGALVATSGAVALTDVITIEGFGKFNISDISDMKLHRAITPINESKDWTVVVPAGLVIGDAVEVRIYAKTSRYQSEVSNNFIGAARPITFMTLPLTAVADTDIRTAIVAAWVDRAFQFNNETPVISVTAGAAATDIDVASATGYESVTVTKIELRRVQTGIASQTPVSLAVNVVNAVGEEGLGTGKFLEESVRMATGLNTNPYGIDTNSTNVDIRGEYTEVSFAISTTYDENLSTLAADNGPLPARHRFTVWMNEATMIAADAAISKMAAAAILAAGVNAGSTATVQAAPLTRLQEETESLILEDRSSVATVAAFIA